LTCKSNQRWPPIWAWRSQLFNE